ncbi:MAG: hypothetical protein WC615_00270 [Mucilaginibacter sp.]|jgi:hypothetical protein|uniref:hypothetical protein n=1 Tax=Mucilaginibacter sp. TaxID=1882438 RepID=UPI00356653B5
MKILIDYYHLHKTTKRDFLVIDESTYRQARGMLLNYAMKGSADFDYVHIYQAPFTSWFEDVPAFVELVTPRSVLAAKYPGMILPSELSDASIYALDLINESIVPSEREIFKHFFGSEMPQDAITVNVLYTLSQICAKQKRPFDNEYLLSLWRSLILSLRNLDTQFLNELTDPLLNVDTEYAEVLSESIYCAKNKLYFERWQHDHARYLHDLGIDQRQLRELLTQQMPELPVNHRFEKSMYRFIIESFENKTYSLNIISGAYPSEANALIHQKQQLALEDYQILSERFAGRLNYSQQQSLRLLCRPVFTPAPELDGLLLPEQNEKWTSWAIESFIPFKFYYDELAEIEPEILLKIHEGSTLYSDWLYNNYRAILNNTNILTNLDVIAEIREILDDPGYKVIWLIIDGFPAYFAPALRGILKKYGINKIDLKWSLATLPTITELGIPIMLAGTFDTSITPQDFGNRQVLLNKALHDKRCYYTTKLNDFQQTIERKSDLCCLHTHEIDTLLHKNDSEFDTSRAAQIEEILEKRIKMISEIIKDSTDKKIKFVISTDHGATKCLSRGQNIKNIRLEEAVKDRARERCVALQGSLSHEQIDHEEMYVLKSSVSQNRADWAIARGYKYFGKHDSGYRHGGLSPEETIVPLMICEVSTAIEIQVQLRYIGIKDLSFGKTEKDFRIKIKNSGSTAIEILSLSVTEDQNCIFELPLQIASESDAVVKGSIKIPQKLQVKARGGRLELNFNIDCLIMGERISQQLQCIVATTKDDFEDDFDF